MRIDSVRTRLTLFYVGVLAVVLVVVGGVVYILLARVLASRVDESLVAAIETATTSLRNDLQEGQDAADASRSTAAELSSRLQMLAIYDGTGRLLAESGRDKDLDIHLPRPDTIPSDRATLVTVPESDGDDSHRLVMRTISFPDHQATFIVVVGSSLEPIDDELAALRDTLASVLPIALLLAGGAGWILAHRSLAPVVAMAERARQLGGMDLSGRLPVANPHDELGRLAATFNELLERLDNSMQLQRQFMADASHELRTPVATTRTAANVALQQPHRDEQDYRRTLEIIEQQATRLSRLVEDMFTLARADAGTYPLRVRAMYLDEVIADVVAAAQVLASLRRVRIEMEVASSAPFNGDEDLIRRLLGNLLDNAMRHSPADSVVRIELRPVTGGYEVLVADRGRGIPPAHQPHVFERFYRVDTARPRDEPDGGAGLGLSLARWVARVHGGEIRLTSSSGAGSTFSVFLPLAELERT